MWDQFKTIFVLAVMTVGGLMFAHARREAAKAKALLKYQKADVKLKKTIGKQHQAKEKADELHTKYVTERAEYRVASRAYLDAQQPKE